jgi:hypothetical protein
MAMFVFMAVCCVVVDSGVRESLEGRGMDGWMEEGSSMASSNSYEGPEQWRDQGVRIVWQRGPSAEAYSLLMAALAFLTCA